MAQAVELAQGEGGVLAHHPLPGGHIDRKAGAGVDVGYPVLVLDVAVAEGGVDAHGGEDLPAGVVREPLPGGGFHHAGHHPHPQVGVGIAATGGVGGKAAGNHPLQGPDGEGADPVAVGAAVHNAGGVGEEVARGDGLVGEEGIPHRHPHYLRKVAVQVQLALSRQIQRQHGGDGLGDGGDAVDGVLIGIAAGLHDGVAAALLVDGAPGVKHHQGHPGNIVVDTDALDDRGQGLDGGLAGLRVLPPKGVGELRGPLALGEVRGGQQRLGKGLRLRCRGGGRDSAGGKHQRQG